MNDLKIFGFARRNYHIAVFALFVAFAAVTMSFTVAYGDDYYYGSFFYEGFSHFVDENIFHYMKTNGRALVHLLDELLLAGGQMVAWRIFGTLCIAAVTLLSALIGAKAYRNGIDTEEFRIALVVSCLLFASISLDIARQSIYWATGALNYLYPILLLLLLFYLVKRGEEKWRCGAAVPVLAFFCAFSTEQCSAGAIAVVAYAFILRIKAKKKPDAAMYFAAVSVALGAALLFLAPGNSVRMTYYPDFYAKSLTERIADNIPAVANSMSGKIGMGTALAILFACHIGDSLAKIKEKREFWRMIPIALCAASVALIVMNGDGTTSGAIRAAFALVALAEIAAEKIIAFFRDGDDGAFFVLISAVLQACMLVSPEYGGRTTLVSVVLLFPIILDGICKRKISLVPTAVAAALLFSYGRFVLAAISVFALAAVITALARKKTASCAFLLAALCALCFDSMLSFACGYGENYAIHRENAARIEQWKAEGDETAPLHLEYLKNGEYKYIMPYDNVPYHWNWYKTYNRLPPSTEVVFDFPD